MDTETLPFWSVPCQWSLSHYGCFPVLFGDNLYILSFTLAELASLLFCFLNYLIKLYWNTDTFIHFLLLCENHRVWAQKRPCGSTMPQILSGRQTFYWPLLRWESKYAKRYQGRPETSEVHTAVKKSFLKRLLSFLFILRGITQEVRRKFVWFWSLGSHSKGQQPFCY